jgi:hypothetical protein
MLDSKVVEGLRALFLSADIPVPPCSAMQNAGIYVSKTTVQVNETDMQERRQNLLNLSKIRGFNESHPISVSGDARYNFQLYLYGLSLQYKFLNDLDISHFFP